MATLWSLVADVLGDEPTDRTIWRAVKSRGSKEVLADVLERHLQAELDPLPEKPDTVLRPAFISDYAGDQETPYDREFRFVAQALCYSDSVAVVDELEGYDDPDLIRAGHMDLKLGFADCDNATWMLRRIARYAQLEEASVLYYCPPPSPRDHVAASSMVTDEMCRELGPDVAQALGWTSLPLLGDGEYTTGLMRHELAPRMAEFLRSLEYSTTMGNQVDLYLSDWFFGPQILQWLERQRMPRPSAYEDDQRLQTRDLNRLLSLPAPASEGVLGAASDGLLTLRSSDQMSAWRSDLGRLVEGISSLASPTEEDFIAFRRELKSMKEAHLRSVNNSPSLKAQLPKLVRLGASTLLLSSALGQLPLATATITAGAAAIDLLWERWRSLPVHQDGERPQESQAAAAIRLYLSDPHPPGGRHRAGGSVTDSQGRLVAFDDPRSSNADTR